mmetsp:Transcript_31477/g.76806  ORF Transcript_31477/g.76806 Transcript_31477/m.76806 type:complete len:282 (+) Transcript_31477:340-1185(+)
MMSAWRQSHEARAISGSEGGNVALNAHACGASVSPATEIDAHISGPLPSRAVAISAFFAPPGLRETEKALKFQPMGLTRDGPAGVAASASSFLFLVASLCSERRRSEAGWRSAKGEALGFGRGGRRTKAAAAAAAASLCASCLGGPAPAPAQDAFGLPFAPAPFAYASPRSGKSLWYWYGSWYPRAAMFAVSTSLLACSSSRSRRKFSFISSGVASRSGGGTASDRSRRSAALSSTQQAARRRERKRREATAATALVWTRQAAVVVGRWRTRGRRIICLGG